MAKQNDEKTRISGTREWSVASVNCMTGCEHDCRYCYARAQAIRFRRIKSAGDWKTPIIRIGEVSKNRKLIAGGRIMFPTAHDITPNVLDSCLKVIEKLLMAGNEILIVSKPHLKCIKSICNRFEIFHKKILFRFSIGSMDDRILSIWEPDAPNFKERLKSLRFAHEAGYATSISCEPLLDVENVRKLFDIIEPFVTDSIWIGKMNRISKRVSGVSKEEIKRIRDGQTHKSVKKVYIELSNEPKVRWKESYKEALGLDLAATSGLDT